MPWVRQALWYFLCLGQGDSQAESGPVVHLAVGPTGAAGQCRAAAGPALGGRGGPPPPWPGLPGPTMQQPGRLPRQKPHAGGQVPAVRRKPWVGHEKIDITLFFYKFRIICIIHFILVILPVDALLKTLELQESAHWQHKGHFALFNCLVIGHTKYKLEGVQRVYCNLFPAKPFHGSH